MLLGESALSNDKIRTVRPRERARGTFELLRKRGVQAHSSSPGKSAFLGVPSADRSALVPRPKGLRGRALPLLTPLVSLHITPRYWLFAQQTCLRNRQYLSDRYRQCPNKKRSLHVLCTDTQIPKVRMGAGSQDVITCLILPSPRPHGRPKYRCKVCGAIRILGETHQL